MKINFLKVALIAGFTSFGLLACNESPANKEEKVEEAQENLAEAEQNLEQAKTDSINEYQQFRQDADLRLKTNDEKIAELKQQMANDKKDMKAKYEKKINEVETRNNNLRTKLNDRQEGDSQTSWASFKQSINEEMDEVGKSISDMAQKNMDKND